MIQAIIRLSDGNTFDVDSFSVADKQAHAKRLIATGKYIDIENKVEVSKEQGIEILENERLALVKLRDELEKREKELLINEDTLRGEQGKLRIAIRDFEIEKEEFFKNKTNKKSK